MPEKIVFEEVDLSSQDLFAGEHPPVALPITLLQYVPAGEDPATGSFNTRRGLVLGRISASDILVNWDEEAEDGSENAVAILATDISDADMLAGDVAATAYFHGPFKVAALDFGDAGAEDIAAEILKLEARALYIVGTPTGGGA